MTIPTDVRLEYLESVSSLVLKFKPDKWSKMIGTEENMALFTEFFEKPDVLVLVLTLNSAGMIIPCLGFPASLKSKGMYFIKKRPESIGKDNYKERLVYGDISPTPVDQLIAIVEEVCAPGLGVGVGGGGEEQCLLPILCVSGLEPCSSGVGPQIYIHIAYKQVRYLRARVRLPWPLRLTCFLTRPPGDAVQMKAEWPWPSLVSLEITRSSILHWGQSLPTASKGVGHSRCSRRVSQF